jgi:hypothetical protein
VCLLVSSPAFGSNFTGGTFTTANGTLVANSFVGSSYDIACPTGYGTWCGQGYTQGLTSFNGANGWHTFRQTPLTSNCGSGVNSGHFTSAGFDSQCWLQNNKGPGGPTITLCSSTQWSSANQPTCWGQLVFGSFTNNWRAPSNGTKSEDTHYLTTTDTSHRITIQFGTPADGCTGCISAFAFYWGSVDSWNTITFTDSNGVDHSFTGAALASLWDPSLPLRQNDTASYVVEFVLEDPNDTGNVLTWQSVSFSSGSPAFEFDNISWNTYGCAVISLNCTGGAPIFGGAPTQPTPEPSSLVLLVSGVAGLVLRRRLF